MSVHAARISTSIIDQAIGWVMDNWILLAIIVGVIVLIFVVLALLPAGKAHQSDDFPADSREANDLALGFIQLQNPMIDWNDPTATEIASSKSSQKALAKQWGLNTRDDWAENVQRLIGNRRRRTLWQELLGIRAGLAARLGRVPTSKEWLTAIREAGGSGKGDERKFVTGLMHYENKARKSAKKGGLFEAGDLVTSLDGYALGQAVAVCVWSVGMGLITREESAQAIREINAIARAEFDSWAAFGRSYVLGRTMHWSDAEVEDEFETKQTFEMVAFARAMNGDRNGPWGNLAWKE